MQTAPRALLTLFLIFIASAVCVDSAQADLLAHEPFDYDAGDDNLLGKDGGVGFSGGWSRIKGVAEVRAGSLVPDDPDVQTLKVSGNKCWAPSDDNYMYFRRNFDLAAMPAALKTADGKLGKPGATLWASFLCKPIEKSAPHAEWTGFKFTGGAEGWWGRNAQQMTWGMESPKKNTDIALVEGKTVLLVLRLDFNADNVNGYLWVDPDLSEEPAIAEADASNVQNSFTIDHVRMSTSTEAEFDEFRMASTWADLTPQGLAAPSASPDGGTYLDPQTVTLSTPSPGASIRYTTDGAEPTDTSTLYTGPLTVEVTTTLKARTFKAGEDPSGTTTAAYVIKCKAPTFNPTGGPFSGVANVTMATDTPGASIRYTLDGSDPDQTDTLYTGPVELTDTTTVKARAFKAGLATSDVASTEFIDDDSIHWCSWDANIHDTPSGGNHAAITGTDGASVAQLRFYKSSMAWSVEPPLGDALVHRGAAHPDAATNHLSADYWYVSDEGALHRPYFGKSSVARGNDAGEAGPYPGGATGQMDLQAHAPKDDYYNVVAFVAPADGDYTVHDFGVRRVTDAAGEVSVRIQAPDTRVLADSLLTAGADRDWVLAGQDFRFKNLKAGDLIRFVIHRGGFADGGNWSGDDVEIAFHISNVAYGEASGYDTPSLDPGTGGLLHPPTDMRQWDEWRRTLYAWRAQQHASNNYDPDTSTYNDAEYQWGKSNVSCYFAMLWDTRLLDPDTGQFKTQEFIQLLNDEFGGVDSIMLWQAYPRLGVDDRNQFDHYRHMPGGVAGMQQLIDDFQAAGIRCYLAYNPWDVYTKREPGEPALPEKNNEGMLTVCRDMVVQLGADGVFLDTMQSAEFLRNALDGPAGKDGVILEGESMASLNNLYMLHNSWAQNTANGDGTIPAILRNKWFEPRHINHQIVRWSTNHTNELQLAFMNGSGMMIWENVFSAHHNRRWSYRDRGFQRLVRPILKRYVEAFTGFETWTPQCPTIVTDVYANRWQHGGRTIWTLINRDGNSKTGELIEVDYAPGMTYYDLVNGVQLNPTPQGGKVRLAATIRARGPACFMAVTPGDELPGFNEIAQRPVLVTDAPGDELPGLNDFLAAQAAASADVTWTTDRPARNEVLTAPTPTEKYTTIDDLPANMALLPAVDDYPIDVSIRWSGRECRDYTTPNKNRTTDIGPLAMDLTPVTNAQYEAFLTATGYTPTHETNFLEQFDESGQPPIDKADHPVTWVSLDDARAYAAWAGKRLPTEDEWMYAADGPNRNAWPWGASDDPTRRNGAENDGSGPDGNGYPLGGTSPVMRYDGTGGYGDGRSPFGLYDMCGNVWELIEGERHDNTTHFNVLKGGSWYEVKIEEPISRWNWYGDGGAQRVGFATKYLMVWPGLDRSEAIGFRCAADLHDRLATDEPDDAIVEAGDTAARALVTMGTRTIAYQWKVNGQPIDGATSSTFETDPVTFNGDHGDTYACTIVGADGTITTRAAVLSVLVTTPGDFNGDGAFNGLDIPGFKQALAYGPEVYKQTTGIDPTIVGDFNGDGAFNGLDIPGFKAGLAGG